MGKIIDLTGQRFGKLKVIKFHSLDYRNRALWKCKCDCGNFHVVAGTLLRGGSVRSCGCSKIESTIKRNTTHGLSKHPIYNIWIHIKRRCYNENYPDYKDYGGRGITICDEWIHDFKAFYDWSISHGWKRGLSIDRIDNNGIYEPANCRWTTIEVQANNTRRIHAITYMGKTQSMMDWCKELDLDYYAVRSRINSYHWSIEKTFTTPTRRGFHKLHE